MDIKAPYSELHSDSLINLYPISFRLFCNQWAIVQSAKGQIQKSIFNVCLVIDCLLPIKRWTMDFVLGNNVRLVSSSTMSIFKTPSEAQADRDFYYYIFGICMKNREKNIK